MKTNWLRVLRNSVLGFLCCTLVAAPWAAAQAPAGGQPLEEYAAVLGIEKSQIDEGAAQGEPAVAAVKTVRKELTDAVAAFQRRDFAAATKSLEAAFNANKSLPPPNVMMARLCFASNDQNVVNQGRAHLELAATSDASKTLPEPYLLFGRLALREGRLTDAELNFQRALDYAPKAEGQSGLGTTTGWTQDRINTFLKEIYAGMAGVAEQRRNWNDAENHLDAWLGLDQEDAMAQFRKGRVLFLKTAQKGDPKDKKDYSAAQESLTRAYDLAQKSKDKKPNEVTEVPPPELAMLQLYIAIGDNDAAQKVAEELEAKADSYPEDKEKSRVLSALSQWHLQRNNAKKAGDLAVRAYSFDKESPAMAQLSAVMHYYANDAEARREFEEINKNMPDNFVASNFLALLLCESAVPEDKNKAVRLAELNYRLNQNSPDAVSTLGWVYHRAGRTNEALQVYGALLQAVNQGQAQISADAAYYMARVIADSPAVQGKMDAVMSLLQRATDSTGPFKNRAVAQLWYDQLKGGGLTPPNGQGSTIPLSSGTPTPPATTTPAPKAPSGTSEN